MRKAVLVVEDNALLVEIYKALFASMNCRVVLARNVADGVAALGSQDGAAKELDLAMIDIRLPDGSGVDVIREIRKRPALKDVPVITVSTKAMEREREAARLAGGTAFLAKPINVDELDAMVRRHLGI
ncbi:response regulator [Alsobacter sp. SYSU BS001988]